jgi:hypothetical protein
MLKEFRIVFPLLAAVATALSAYWLLHDAFHVATNDIFNGGIVGAAFVGAAYLGTRRAS